MHYLDHNATTPMRPEVIQAMAEAMGQVGNPSSAHGFGRKAKAMVEKAREQVAALVGAQRPQDVIFTGSGTEANNMALRAYPDMRCAVSAVEHDAILQARSDRSILSVDTSGQLSSASDAELVAVQLANNETGIVIDLPEAPHLHVDAVQAAGKIPVAFDDLSCQTLALSAHKIGGPQGMGALVIKPGLDMPAMIAGGGQERRRRAGTENVAGIVGFGLAAELAVQQLHTYAPRTKALRDRFEAQLPDWVQIVGAKAKRLPNTSCLLFPGKRAETLMMKFDLGKVAVSSGSACSSGKIGASHVLTAMGIAPDLASSAIRFSFGWNSTDQDVDAALAVIQKLKI